MQCAWCGSVEHFAQDCDSIKKWLATVSSDAEGRLLDAVGALFEDFLDELAEEDSGESSEEESTGEWARPYAVKRAELEKRSEGTSRVIMPRGPTQKNNK